MNKRHTLHHLVAALLALAVASCSSTPAPSPATDASPVPDTLVLADVAPDVLVASDQPRDESRPLDTGCTTDDDGDGVLATSCGGNDCDDSDPHRFPGNAEVCDATGHDEDCNPCTVASSTTGDGDGDTDTFVSIGCYNTFRGATPTCDPMLARVDGAMLRVTGRDCDDANANVRPNQTETCNGLDDNCNGMIDEGVATNQWFRDLDRDGHGDIAASAIETCANPSTAAVSYVTTHDDCDDTDPLSHPMAEERCDGRRRDENCDGVVDEGCDCDTGADRGCLRGPMMPAAGVCASGRQRCVAGHWGECSIQPSPEVCNALDDDCDGATDEATTVPAGATPPAGAITETACGGIVGGQCLSGACRCPPGRESCGGTCRETGAACSVGVGACARTGRLLCAGTDVQCDATAGVPVTPGSPGAEVCNDRDDDCDGMTDEGLHAAPEFSNSPMIRPCGDTTTAAHCLDTAQRLCAGRMFPNGVCTTNAGFSYISLSDINRHVLRCFQLPTSGAGASIIHQEFRPIEIGTSFYYGCTPGASGTTAATCPSLAQAACVNRGYVGGLYYLDNAVPTSPHYYLTCLSAEVAQSVSVSYVTLQSLVPREVSGVLVTPCTGPGGPYQACSNAAARYCAARGFSFGVWTGSGDATNADVLCIRGL